MMYSGNRYEINFVQLAPRYGLLLDVEIIAIYVLTDVDMIAIYGFLR